MGRFMMEKNKNKIISTKLIILDYNTPKDLFIDIYIPKQMDGCWVCEYTIYGDLEKEHRAYGESSLQCLYLTLDLIRKYLNEKYNKLKWEGGVVGEHGFPIIVPPFLNKDTQKTIEKIISNELEKPETWR